MSVERGKMLTKRRLLGLLASALILGAILAPITTASALSVQLNFPTKVTKFGIFQPFILNVRLDRGEIFFIDKVQIIIDQNTPNEKKVEFRADGTIISKDPIFLIVVGKIKVSSGYGIGPTSSAYLVILNKSQLSLGNHSIVANVLTEKGTFSSGVKAFRVR